MSFRGDVILVDEIDYSLIGIYLGFQPSASASHGGGAEIQQNGLVGGERLAYSLVHVGKPVDRSHNSPPSSFDRALILRNGRAKNEDAPIPRPVPLLSGVGPKFANLAPGIARD